MLSITDINKQIILYSQTPEILALHRVNRQLRDDIDAFVAKIYQVIRTQASSFPCNLLTRISSQPPSTFCTIYKFFEIAHKFVRRRPSFVGMNLEALQEMHDANETEALTTLNNYFDGHSALLAAAPNSLDALCLELLKDPALSLDSHLLVILTQCIELYRTEVIKAFIASPHFQRLPLQQFALHYVQAAKAGSDGCLALLCDAILTTQHRNDPVILKAFDKALESAKQNGHVHCIDILTPHIQRVLLNDRITATALCISSFVLGTVVNRLISPYGAFSYLLTPLGLIRSFDSVINLWIGRFFAGNKAVDSVSQCPGELRYLGLYYLAQIGLTASTKFLEKKLRTRDIYVPLCFTSTAAAAVARFKNPYLNILALAVGTCWMRRIMLHRFWW